MSNFQRLELFLGYNFKNHDLIKRALSHQSTNSDISTNANHLEFIGSSCLHLAILQQSIILAPATLRAGQVVVLNEKITSSLKTLNKLFKELEIENLWEIDPILETRVEERIWAISAICGALFLDGGYPAVTQLAIRVLENHEQDLPRNDEIDPNLPWRQWQYRQTIRLESIDSVFPRCISAKTYRFMPWALETHIRPGISNNRSYQLFELGDAALRWAIDLEMFLNNKLEPLENRFLHREHRLKSLGLEARKDQIFASCFSSQDWRRQSLDYRTQSLKNILAAVLISEGEQQARTFSRLILNKANTLAAWKNNSSVVFSPLL